MKMAQTDISKYPKFYSYVKNDISSLISSSSIVSAIKKFSGSTTRSSIKQGLMWGSGPNIKIVPTLVCAGSNAYGCYYWGSNEIQIDESLVKSYESGKDLRHTKKGALVSVAGVTLLHELTHWADAKDGVDDPVPGDPTNEEGNAFEFEVYGKIIVL
ncbi:hypothetical protein N8878_04620 [Psychromonas sp.]|nr:hypothetical protein [Psychromonas sp.]